MSGVSYVDSATGASGTEATSTNQATQITLETAIRDRIGEVQASPTSNTVLDRLKALLTGIVLAAGANRIGKVTVRASSDGADIDPVAESTFTSRIGEVQASPTSNTVLDRLKALLTGIVLAAGANRIGKVTVRASSDGADIDPVAESTFTSRIGEVQASPTTNTLLGRLKDLLTGIILAAGENHIGEVGGRSIRVSSSFTRPADTALYATGDNMADSTSAPTVNTITGCARVNGGSGVILGASLIDSANQATVGQFEAWVFDTTWTPDNDNAAFTPTDAECANLVAIIPLTTSYVGDATSGAGGNRVYFSDAINRGFVCAGGSTSLYWALVARNGYTPVSAEVFTLRLSILQN